MVTVEKKGVLMSGTVWANLAGIVSSYALYAEMIKPEVAAIVGGITGLLAIWRRIKVKKQISGII